MAINWVEGVLENSNHTGTNLLLMILLAESANRDTGCCYPGIPTLARLMRCSERNVQKRIADLVESGEITVRRNGSHARTNLYTLSPALLDTNHSSPIETNYSSPSEPTPIRTTVHHHDEPQFTPDTNSSSPKPLVEPLVEPLDISRAKKRRTPRQQKPFPADWQPNAQDIAFAISKGMPESVIPDEVVKIIDHHTARGKTTADVSASWRTWCQNYRQYNRSNGYTNPVETGWKKANGEVW